MYNLLRAAFAALILLPLFSCRTASQTTRPTDTRTQIDTTFRPTAFLRVGESVMHWYDGNGSAGTGALTVDTVANTITLTTTAQILPVSIDLYEDERAAWVTFEDLGTGAGYRWTIRPADKGVKVSDVVLVWIYAQ